MGIIGIVTSGELYKLRRYRIWKTYITDYTKDPLHALETFRIHRKGFTKSDWQILGLKDADCGAYLKSADYSRVHPINGYYSKIVDDKMVVKYVLSGHGLGEIMPKYYYLIDEGGDICPLMDAPSDREPSVGDIFQLLREQGKLAFKLVTGSIGKGFYKLEYQNGRILANEEEMGYEAFCRLIQDSRNYVVSEYLTPHPYLAEFWPDTANTMRVLVGRVGREWRMIKGFIRFGSSKTGVVENFNRGGVLCYIEEDGRFHNGYQIGFHGKKPYIVPVKAHPDTKKVLEGRIPCWELVTDAVDKIERLLPETKYLGFDFVITDKNEAKLLEINSLTSLDSLQLDRSILETENGKWFFSSLGI